MGGKAPTNVDRIVGLRVRRERQRAGMTMEQLACEIGVSTQQIQKYETGVNRLAPSHLYAIGRALGRRVTCFVDRLEEEAA